MSAIVLVVGGGGREMAQAVALAASPQVIAGVRVCDPHNYLPGWCGRCDELTTGDPCQVKQVFCAPGNGGTAQVCAFAGGDLYPRSTSKRGYRAHEPPLKPPPPMPQASPKISNVAIADSAIADLVVFATENVPSHPSVSAPHVPPTQSEAVEKVPCQRSR